MNGNKINILFVCLHILQFRLYIYCASIDTTSVLFYKKHIKSGIFFKYIFIIYCQQNKWYFFGLKQGWRRGESCSGAVHCKESWSSVCFIVENVCASRWMAGGIWRWTVSIISNEILYFISIIAIVHSKMYESSCISKPIKKFFLKTILFAWMWTGDVRKGSYGAISSFTFYLECYKLLVHR